METRFNLLISIAKETLGLKEIFVSFLIFGGLSLALLVCSGLGLSDLSIKHCFIPVLIPIFSYVLTTLILFLKEV